jgi:hypothetical protein
MGGAKSIHLAKCFSPQYRWSSLHPQAEVTFDYVGGRCPFIEASEKPAEGQAAAFEFTVKGIGANGANRQER